MEIKTNNRLDPLDGVGLRLVLLLLLKRCMVLIESMSLLEIVT